MGSDATNIAFLICCAVLFVVHIRLLFPSVCCLRRDALLGKLRTWGNSLRGPCLRSLSHGLHNPFDACVERNVSLLLQENAAATYRFLMYGSACGLVLMANDAVLGLVRGDVAWWVPRAVLLLSVCTCLAVVNTAPAFSKGAWPCFWYIVFNAFLSAFLYCSEPSDYIAKQVLFFTRLLCGVSYPYVAPGVFCNAAYAAISVSGIRIGTPYPMWAWNPFQFLQGLLLEGVQALIILLFMQNTLRSFWSRATHSVQEKAWKGEGGAMLSLLNLVCDVVVELDSDLRVVEHVPRFAAMLALPNFKDIAGMRFQDFMAFAEDQEAFGRVLLHSEGEHRSTGVVHVRLRDSMGNHIKVEIFFVEFVALDDCVHFFAGIREFAEYTVAELKSFGPAGKPKRNSRRHSTSANPGPTNQATVVGTPIEEVGPDPALSDSGSSGSGRSRRSEASFAPAFVPTTDVGKEVSIVATVARWYTSGSQAHCCPFHAAVADVQACAERLEAYHCTHEFVPARRQQCANCGVLAAEGRGRVACDMCGQRLTTRARLQLIRSL